MMNDKTLHDSGAPTVREQALPGSGPTGVQSFPDIIPEGLRLVSRLSVQGSEAELYIVEDGGETRVLKFYRQGGRLKGDVLEKCREVSVECPEHVIRIFQAGLDPRSGRWYEIQELASCGSIADWLADGLSLDFEEFVAQLAGAAHALHQRGIVHRDLKPGNILVRSACPLDLALTDFGVASMLESGLDLRETLHKGFTPMYAAPEDFDGGIVSPAADWWACGMIFLEVLTGKHPFQGLSPARIAYFLATRAVAIDPSLPERRQMLLKGLLTRNDKQRWGWREIQAWLAGRTDIPAHYSASGPETECQPFRFLGKSFASPREMALCFASDYVAWQAGRGTLARGNIARWLADCREYDEERIVSDELADNDADIYLARFIAHYVPDLSPRLFGLELTSASLLGWLARPAEERSEAESAALAFIVERKGALAKLPGISGNAGSDPADPALAALAGRNWQSPEKLRNSLLALVSPESFYWGPGGAPESCVDRLDFLERTPGILTMKSWEEMGGPALPLTPRVLELFESGRYSEAIKSLLASKKPILSQEDYAFIRQLAREYGLNESWVDFLEKALELINLKVREKADNSLFASALERGLDFFSEANIAHMLLRIFIAGALGRSDSGQGAGEAEFPFFQEFEDISQDFAPPEGRENSENREENGADPDFPSDWRAIFLNPFGDLGREAFASLAGLLEKMGLRRQ